MSLALPELSSSSSSYDVLPLRDLPSSSLTYAYPSASTIPSPNSSQNIRDQATKYLKMLDREILYKEETNSFNIYPKTSSPNDKKSNSHVSNSDNLNNKWNEEGRENKEKKSFGDGAADRKLIMKHLQMITNNILFDDNKQKNKEEDQSLNQDDNESRVRRKGISKDISSHYASSSVAPGAPEEDDMKDSHHLELDDLVDNTTLKQFISSSSTDSDKKNNKSGNIHINGHIEDETPYNCVRRTRNLVIPGREQDKLKNFERKYQFHFNEFLTAEEIQQISKEKENFGSNLEFGQSFYQHDKSKNAVNLCREISKIDVDDYLSNRGAVEKEFIETYHYLTSTAVEEHHDKNSENHNHQSLNPEVSLINTKGKLLSIDDIINMSASSKSRVISSQSDKRHNHSYHSNEYFSPEISKGSNKELEKDDGKVKLARKQLDLLQQMRRDTMKKMISVSKSQYVQEVEDDENRKSGVNGFSKSQIVFNGKGRLTANNQLDLSNLPEEELIEILSISGNSGDK